MKEFSLMLEKFFRSTSESADRWIRKRGGQLALPPVYAEDEARSIQRTKTFSRRQLLGMVFVGLAGGATIGTNNNTGIAENASENISNEYSNLLNPYPWRRR